MSLSKRFFLFAVSLVIIMMIISSYISLKTTSLNSQRRDFPVLLDHLAPYYLDVEIMSIDTSSSQVKLHISTLFRQINTTGDQSVPIEILSTSFGEVQNLTCVRTSVFPYFDENETFGGSQTYVFQLESRKDLYPFDTYHISLLFYFPEISTNDFEAMDLSLPAEVTGFLCIRDTTISHVNSDTVPAIILVDFTVTRPVAYQILVFLPVWFIFFVVFVVSGLDAAKKEEFKSKISIYAALFIFSLGFSLLGISPDSVISEMLKAAFVSTVALFVIIDILIFKRISISNSFPSRGLPLAKYVKLEDVPFIISMVILAFFTLQFIDLTLMPLGIVFQLLTFIPLIAMTIWQYFSRSKLLYLTGWTIIALQSLILFLNLLAYLFR